MAAQRITIAKVAGEAAGVVLRRLQGWADARRTSDPEEWSNEQWPPEVRRRVDAFAERLRSHAAEPPVVHYAEWADLWSMGDVFMRWLTPPDGSRPLYVHADHVEVYGYGLPDGGRLARHLAGAGPQLFEEYTLFGSRLREAVEAWRSCADRAALVVLREVVGGLVTDDELTASLAVVPEWLREE
jgi:hypothetical protein